MLGKLVDIEDVKSLIDDIYEREKDIINMDYKRNTIKDRIDELDTAFDVNSFVSQLEDLGNEECSYYEGTPYKDVIIECINKVLEIVKSNTNRITQKGKNISNNNIKPKTRTKEYMLSIDELKIKFPVGSKHTINGKDYIVKSVNESVSSNYMASFPSVTYEEYTNNNDIEDTEDYERLW